MTDAEIANMMVDCGCAVSAIVADRADYVLVVFGDQRHVIASCGKDKAIKELRGMADDLKAEREDDG